MDKFLKVLITNGHEILMGCTVFAAMTLQYILGDNKGVVAFYVTLAGTLVAGFTLHIVMNYMGVAVDSPVRTLVLILSSFIGTPVLVILSKTLAPAIAAKILEKIKES